MASKRSPVEARVVGDAIMAAFRFKSPDSAVKIQDMVARAHAALQSGEPTTQVFTRLVLEAQGHFHDDALAGFRHWTEGEIQCGQCHAAFLVVPADGGEPACPSCGNKNA